MSIIVCECCWFNTVELSLRSASRFCPTCRSHEFTLGSLRADHAKLAEGVKTSHAMEVAQVRERIEHDKVELVTARAQLASLVKAKGAELADAPETILEAIRGAAVSELQDRVRDAFYARNRAMGAVWTLDERHHAGVGEKCSCGQVLHKCAEFQALGYFRDEYERWERKQIELMKAGKSHGLPENHPEARKLNVPSYRWRGMRSTERDSPYRKVG